MRRKLTALAVGAAIAGLAWPAAAAAPAPNPNAPLIERVKLWMARDRDDLARQALDKLFRVAPDDPDGLALLAGIQIRAADRAAAQSSLERLRKRAPEHPGIAGIETQLRMQRQNRDQLRRVQQLAAVGKYDAAAAQLRSLFPVGAPDGDLGREYWEIVGGTPNGWDAARAGLAKLVRDNPDNLHYRLALAQHVAKRYPGNREALDTIVELSKNRALGREARAAWRRTMLRLDGVAASLPLLDAYLREDGADTAVREYRDAVARNVETQRRLMADPHYRARLDGLALLDNGKLDAAEDLLTHSLSGRPADAETVGGMGLLRLRQGHHAEADAYFQRAQQLDPAQQSRWNGLLQAARFWGLLREAANARDNGEFALAGEKIVAARRIDPREPNGVIALARVLEAQQTWPQAEQSFRDAAAMVPGNPEAIEALVGFYLRRGRDEAAETQLHRLTPAQYQPAAAAFNAIQASILRYRADRLLTQKQTADAITQLKRATILDRDDPWGRLALARIYAAAGQAEKGQELFDELLQRRPGDAGAHYAAAIYRSGRNEELAAMRLLEAVPPPDRSANMTALQRRLWTSLQGRRALWLAGNGKKDEARRLLADMGEAAADDPDQLLDVADVWIDFGDAGVARELLARAERRLASETALRLRHVRLLARSGAGDEAIAPHLDAIAALPLTVEEDLALADLRLGLALAEAERLRAQDRQAEAETLLHTQLLRHPQNSRLRYALARIQRAQEKWPAAAENILAILEFAPDDGDAVESYVDTLVSAQRSDDARAWIDMQLTPEALDRHRFANGKFDPAYRAALAAALLRLEDYDRAREQVAAVLGQSPRQPRALDVAGRLAQHDGRYEEAIAHWQRALASRQMEQRLPPPAKGPAALIKVAVTTGESTANATVLPIAATYADTGPAAADDNAPAVSPGPLPPLSQLSVSAGEAAPVLQATTVPPSVVADEVGYEGTYRRLAEAHDLQNTWFAAAVDSVSRSGAAGRSQYRVVEIPAEWRTPWQLGDAHGRLVLHADTVRIDAGALNPADADNTDKFGSLLLCPGCLDAARRQTASGIAPNAAFETDRSRIDIGTTPLGFPVVSLVGGWYRKGDFGRGSYSVDVSRRAVSGSLLSYAGTRDPNTGRIWGGVVATGARLGLSRDEGGAFGAWSSFGLHRLTGENVQANVRMQLMAGGYWRAINEEDRLLSFGTTVMHWRFSKNAGEYTFGHGGYYSPAQYSSLSFPVTFAQRFPRWSYSVRAAASVSRSRTDDALYYPTDGGLQEQAEALPGADPRYTGGSGRGKGRSFSAMWEYQVQPKWFVGARLSLERSVDYMPNRLSFFLRYALDRAAGQPVRLPPEPVGSALGY